MLTASTGIFLITGIMASGKSTVAQLLSEQFKQSVHVRGDIFRKMIVNNRKEVQPDAEYDQLDQLRLRYRLAAQAADTYDQAGFTVVVQDVVIGSMLNETGYGVWTVSALDHVLRNETPRIGMWLDSSFLTPEQTVSEMMQRAEKEALLTL